MALKLNLILLMFFLLSTNLYSQEISSITYIDEESLYQRYLDGEISFSEYQKLLELSIISIETNESFLWDEIPNLTAFGSNYSLNSLEREQKRIFVKEEITKTDRTELKGLFQLKSSLYLEEDPRSRQSYKYRIGYGDLLFDLVHRKEYSGNNRILNRSISYETKKTKIIFGNFNHRFGLGVSFGYRGKLLDYSDEIDKESFLYPDYGGWNGLSLYHNFKQNYTLKLISSYNRDLEYVHRNLGFNLTRNFGENEISIISVYNNLKNRLSEKSVNLFNMSIFAEHKYSAGYVSAEINRQEGENSGFGAFIIEGRHSYNKADIRYSIWSYESDFIDVSSGSKSASLYHQSSLDDIEFTYSSRRADQNGGLLKTILPFSSEVELSTAILFGSFSKDTLTLQYSSMVEYQLSKDLKINLAHFYKLTRRFEKSVVEPNDKSSNKTRGEVYLTRDGLRIRSYLQHNNSPLEEVYFSFLTHIRYKSQRDSFFEVWFNLKKIKKNLAYLEQYYTFLMYRFPIVKDVFGHIKCGHYYDRYKDMRHQTVISLELQALI